MKCSGEAHSGENNPMCGMIGEKSPTFGQIPWTKGKTAKTDEKIAELGRKISSTQKQQFVDGIRSNHGANNPNFGKTPDQRTPEQFERYSKAAAQRVKDGHVGPWKSKKGKYFSAKYNKNIYYKSSYEQRLFKCFDDDITVVSWVYEPLFIIYKNKDTGRDCRYCVDFLIEYSNGIKKLIEAKGAHLLLDNNTIAKKQAAEEYCKQNNMTYEIWTNKEITDYESMLAIVCSEVVSE
jgi:hypothetical protein